MSPASRIVACMMLCGCLFAIPASAQLTPELQQLGAELDALASEIQLITDLNRLQLTRDQIDLLIPAVNTLRASAIASEQQRLGVLRQLKPLLEQERDLALRDAPAPEALDGQISALQAQLADLDQARDEALTGQVATFRGILTEAQVSIITGEEDARRQVVDLIEWVRGMDEETFSQEVPPYAQELADPELDLGEEELMDLLSLARAMDDEQYARSAPEIEGKLIKLFRPAPEAADRIIVSVFLAEAMPKVLADKLALMSGQ